MGAEFLFGVPEACWKQTVMMAVKVLDATTIKNQLQWYNLRVLLNIKRNGEDRGESGERVVTDATPQK